MSKLEEGKKLFEADKFEEALPLFSDYLTENENHGDALFYRGLCHRKVGDFPASIVDFTQLLKRLPEEATIYSERGVSYFHNKQLDESMADMNKAVELEPENPYRYSSRAYIKAFKDVDGAIADYEKATILDPQDEIAYNNLGLLLEKRGKLKAAQAKFKRSNDIIGYDPEKRNATENSVEFGDVDKDISKEVDDRIDKIKAQATEEPEGSVGKIMLDVFRDKGTRQEYFNYLKNLFKKSS